MLDRPIICPPSGQPVTASRPRRSNDQRNRVEPQHETREGERNRRRRLTPRTVPQLRWFAWTLAALVGLCLLLAAWVWLQILGAGL